MKTRKNTQTAPIAISASLILFAASAFADTRKLPTPPIGGYVDAESAVVVSFPTDQGRQVALTLSAPVSETNAIQVALGQDRNCDEDLNPEETALVIGVDCGVPFARDEEGVGNRCRVEFSNSTYTFSFKQPQAVAKRFDVAKVTTRNMATTNAVILADIKRPGLALIIR